MREEALRDNLEEVHRASFSWALSCCAGNRDEAEEVLQLTYLKVLDGRARFGGRSTFKTWLFGVIRRTAREERRRAWLRFRHGRLLARGAATQSDGTPEERVSSDERAARLRSALTRLSQRQREILELVFYHEQTLRQAAAVVGVSLGSASVHYQRGKAKLRDALGDLAPE